MIKIRIEKNFGEENEPTTFREFAIPDEDADFIETACYVVGAPHDKTSQAWDDKPLVLCDARCQSCGHTWRAVFPKGTDGTKLECPACGKQRTAYFETTEIDQRELLTLAARLYRCDARERREPK